MNTGLLAACGIVVTMAICACTTADPKIRGAIPRTIVSSALNGTWDCTPEYSSNAHHGLLPASVGPTNLADVFSEFVVASEVRPCSSATIALDGSRKLVVAFERDGVTSQGQELSAASGLRVADDGMVEMVSKSCSSDLGIGCVKDMHRLFVNEANRLVVIEKSTGAGVALLVLPLAGSDLRMATFERKTSK